MASQPLISVITVCQNCAKQLDTTTKSVEAQTFGDFEINTQANSLSIVIPVYNRAGLIVRTLDSIAAQSMAPLDVIVVDNNSTDGTLQSVEQWKHCHSPLPFKLITASQKTPGACAARNLGASLSSGNILLFFDSDDTMRPSLVENILNRFCDAETKIVYWKKLLHGFNDNTFVAKWSKRPTLDMQVYHSIFNTICYAVRKDLFMQSGQWNEELPCWNDWELGIRLHLQAGEKAIKGINEILVDGFMQKESITGTGFFLKAGKWEKAIEAAEKHATLLPGKKQKHYLRSLELKLAVLAAHYRNEGDKIHANETMKKLLQKYSYSSRMRIILNGAYRYTSFGLRGAFAIFGKLI